MLKKLIGALLVLLGLPAIAAAQGTPALVYASCPSVRTTPYPVGVVGAIAIDINGNLCTSGTGGGGGGGGSVTQGTVPWVVSNAGTFAVQASQSGTWTVQPGNTANTTAWLMSISQGGNTAAVTTAGADGVSNTLSALATYSRMQMFNGTTWDRVLGDTTNGLWVNVKSAVGLAQGSTTSGQTGSMIMGAVTTAAPSYTTAQTSPMSLTTAGALRSDLSTIAGTAAVNGSGTSTGALRVELPTDGTGLVTTNPATAANWGIGATASSVPANAQYNGVNVGGNLVGIVGDPCQTVAKTYAPISQTANTRIITATASKKTYICQIFVVGADAENVSVVEGTGSTCGTSTAAVIGGATAAAGMNFGANSGWSQGMGGFAIAASPGTATDICLFQSGSGRVSGSIAYVQQ